MCISAGPVRELKQQDGSARYVGVPIVFVTAYCDADTLERIYTVVPAAPVLSKPVYRQTLADAVSAATQ